MVKKIVPVKASVDGKKAHTREIEVPDASLPDPAKMKAALLGQAKQDRLEEIEAMMSRDATFRERMQYLEKHQVMFQSDDELMNRYIDNAIGTGLSCPEAGRLFQATHGNEMVEELIIEMIVANPADVAEIARYNTENTDLVRLCVDAAFVNHEPSHQEWTYGEIYNKCPSNDNLRSIFSDAFSNAAKVNGVSDQAVKRYVEDFGTDSQTLNLIVDENLGEAALAALRYDEYQMGTELLTHERLVLLDVIAKDGSMESVIEVSQGYDLEDDFVLKVFERGPKAVQEYVGKNSYDRRLASMAVDAFADQELDHDDIVWLLDTIEQYDFTNLKPELTETLVREIDVTKLVMLGGHIGPEKVFNRVMAEGTPEQKEMLAAKL